MKLLKKILLKFLLIIFGFFSVTFVIYFFNLDMKLMTYVVEPLLRKVYDGRKRKQYV